MAATRPLEPAVIPVTDQMTGAGADMLRLPAWKTDMETPEGRRRIARNVLSRALQEVTAADLSEMLGASNGDVLVPLWNADGSFNLEAFDLRRIRARVQVLAALKPGTVTIAEQQEREVLLTIIRVADPG